MTHAYATDYREIAREEAAKLSITLHEGVYAALLGPSYETPAEIEYLRRIGADLVGMSTVAEVIAARHMGIKVLAISCVTNMAAGILDQPLSHAEVMETGERVKSTLNPCCEPYFPRIEKYSETKKEHVATARLGRPAKGEAERLDRKASIFPPAESPAPRGLHPIYRREIILIHRQRDMSSRVDIEQRLSQRHVAECSSQT